ncbi:YigZ family protein [Marinisporobacter balticus]|uniref:Putative YigZ family protein n=1 Tax=Marinisporobacter balticus TaxID=2018667 RepID=A0A4R2L4B4_9FIRM|nr:YigZ family protein [Marinisporobacter balticus]TCO80087.1 putative YigZ family protein [Marinisporobacter balticus]
MIKRYKTISRYAEVEHIIEKSKFIGYAKPVETEEEAIAFVQEIKEMHKNATHNVPAYIVGKKNEIQRYSDDGEPAGTAGVPILDMLKKEELKNIAIVVTRYFGGIKLGTGGLVRAYTNTAKLVMNKSQVIEKVLHDLIKIRIDYSMLGKVQNEVLNAGYCIKDTIFDDAVNMYVYAFVNHSEEVIKMIKNITSAKGEISIQDTLYLNVLEGKIMKESLG